MVFLTPGTICLIPDTAILISGAIILDSRYILLFPIRFLEKLFDLRHEFLIPKSAERFLLAIKVKQVRLKKVLARCLQVFLLMSLRCPNKVLTMSVRTIHVLSRAQKPHKVLSRLFCEF